MRKSDWIWLVGITLFAVSFSATLLIDLLGLIETSNTGFVETLWISWIMWTVFLGAVLSILVRFAAKE